MSGATDQRREARRGRPERAHPRRKAFQPVALQIGSARERAHVLDISRGGARLHCLTGCVPGDAVEVCVCALRVCGRVMWRRGDRLGVQFDRLLAESEIGSLLG